MKKKITILSILFAGTIIADAQILRAGETADGPHIVTTRDSTFFNKTHAAMFTLRDLLDSVDRELAGHSLLRIHQFTGPIKASVKDFDLDSSLKGKERKKVQKYLHNIMQFADEMHNAANRKQMDETLKWHKQLNKEARLLEKSFEKAYAPPKPNKPMNDAMHHRVGRGRPLSTSRTFSVLV